MRVVVLLVRYLHGRGARVWDDMGCSAVVFGGDATGCREVIVGVVVDGVVEIVVLEVGLPLVGARDGVELPLVGARDGGRRVGVVACCEVVFAVEVGGVVAGC